jgi:3-dehydroquinate synthase
MGMKIITERAILKGLCDKTVGDVLDRLLSKYNLLGECEYTLTELYDITLIDKKRKGDGITLVVPKTIGKCELLRLTINEWKEFLLG